MSVAAAIATYADRFHRAAGAEHHVASPVGAWLLLALVAPAATGRTRNELEAVLGCDIAAADGFARALLTRPHPAVALAAAAWSALSDPPADLTAWLRDLEPVADVGPMPTQHAANQWARDKTLGLIDEFPLRVEVLALVLTSALATRINWVAPFDTFPSAWLQLPAEPALRPESMLVEHQGAIVNTPVGPVGLHAKRSREHDLVVVSVIAEPSVAAADVLRAAYPLAIAASRDVRPLPGEVPSAELPLGPAHSWMVRDAAAASPSDEHMSVLPAWSATSRFDLLSDPGFGAGPALDTMQRWADGPPEAVQVALARYTRTGFEAAAVTAFALGVSASAGGTVRQARIEFTHPYAVVAVARGGGPWDGLPVFSAWITEADETDPAPR